MSYLVRRFYSFKAENPSAIRKLLQPIGDSEPPSIYANSGIDTRSIQQRKEDFLNLEKNRERREHLKKEFAKSSYDSIYGFRDTGGKFFTSPPAPWTSEKAKYMPNFRGLTLDKRETGSMEFLNKKSTIVRIFSSTLGFNQIKEYTTGIDFEKSNLGLLDINTPTSWINQKLVQLFSRGISKSLEGSYHHYMISRKGVTPSLRHTIWAGNKLGGYLYLVDKDSKIRWAASGPASDAEKRVLLKAIKELN